MSHKVALDFVEIGARLKRCALPEVDRVVGIGSGGVVPAALLAYKLERPLTILSINYRDRDNQPRYETPKLLTPIRLPTEDKKLLLVDDVSVSGKTLAVAKEQLMGYEITTLVMKGQGDIVLFPEIAACVQWPWQEKK